MRVEKVLPPDLDAASVEDELGEEGFTPVALTWEDVAWLRSVTSLPVVLKGILHPEDAALSVEHGAAGIVVSTHGGRQLDTVCPSIEALPAIVEAVGGGARRFTWMAASGVAPTSSKPLPWGRGPSLWAGALGPRRGR